MRRNRGRGEKGVPDGHESHFGKGRNPAETFGISAVHPGQIDPRHCPYQDEAREAANLFPLGEPLSIEDVALLLGCSPWTVRQKYLPQGLPHLRASLSGKLVFFREQVVTWILERQRKEECK